MRLQLSLIALFVVVATLKHQRRSYAAAAAASTSSSGTQTSQRNLFAADLFNAVAAEKLNDNVVISPAAVHCSMALARYGAAEGATVNEMQTGFRFTSTDADLIVRQFSELQREFTRDNYVKLFNGIYINEKLEFRKNFQDVASTNFNTNIQKADFHPPYNKRTADRINKLIETKTDNKVKDTFPAVLLNDLTEGVIVNALSFMGSWQKAFQADKTELRNFHAGSKTFEVDTMYTVNNFLYGEFGNLDAKAIELPYENGDFSMIILLPNSKTGLQKLLKNLVGKDLVTLVSRVMQSKKVKVHLPKFSVSYGLNLVDAFKSLGVTTPFTRDGDFSKMYRMFVRHYINVVVHKAYIEVKENGVEPALETGFLKGIFSSDKEFDANHPFVFAIRHRDSIILMGHIANYAFV